jgi:hypothetical protein
MAAVGAVSELELAASSSHSFSQKIFTPTARFKVRRSLEESRAKLLVLRSSYSPHCSFDQHDRNAARPF